MPDHREWSGWVLESPSGTCPSVERGADAIERLVDLVERATTHIAPCTTASATADPDIPWRRVAPVIAALRHRADYRFVHRTAHLSQRPDPCRETVAVEQLSTHSR